ncbi:MAG: hypothetical protein OXE44_01710 [Nitrospinae bacterium]|nr:hypothetical protein [Nitrospinota bacterium]
MLLENSSPHLPANATSLSITPKAKTKKNNMAKSEISERIVLAIGFAPRIVINQDRMNQPGF